MNEAGALRYRCHVGHAFTGETLIAQQSNSLEDALWAAVRGFEENARLAEKMADRSRTQGHLEVESRFVRRAEQARVYADELRRALERIDALTEPSV